MTLTIGIFAGHNWDVPQGEPYAIIDEVIKNFEAENPGVQVKCVSGIKKEDYSEGLAEQFIDGAEPDVFFVLAEDFNLYASIGALMNLESLMASEENFSADVYYPAAFIDHASMRGRVYSYLLLSNRCLVQVKIF